MNISGIRANAGFYDYSIVKNNEIRSQQIMEAKASFGTAPVTNDESTSENTGYEREQNFTSLDYAKQYQPDMTYEMKGADSDLASLDVEAAISTMQQDQVIQQYQFFVGAAKVNQIAGMEGAALEERKAENFIV